MIDPSIALQVKPIQFESPVNALGPILQAQAAMRQNQLGAMQLKQQQSTDDETNALRAGLQAGKYDLATPRGRSDLLADAPTKGSALLKSYLDSQETEAKTKHYQAQTEGLTQEQKIKESQQAREELARELATVNDYDGMIAWTSKFPVKGLASMAQAQRTIERLPKDPSQIAEWKLRQYAYFLDPKAAFEAQKPSIQTRNTGGTTDTIAIDPITGKPTVTGSARNTQSPDSVASTGLGYARLAEAKRQHAAAEAGGGVEGFTPGAVEAAAARYNLDGTLPPMGMGKAGTQGRQAILNRAAELAAGISGTDQRAGQLGNKADAAALTKVSAQKNMVASFEKTANSNADLALDLSGKLDRSNINIFNRWLQAGRTGAGSVEAAQFNAANETFVNEYAKIVSGSMGNTAVSDAARKHAHDVISTAQSKEQYAGVIKTLKAEMANRMKGFEDQETELKSRLRGTQKSSQPSASDLPADVAEILQKHGAK